MSLQDFTLSRACKLGKHKRLPQSPLSSLPKGPELPQPPLRRCLLKMVLREPRIFGVARESYNLSLLMDLGFGAPYGQLNSQW